MFKILRTIKQKLTLALANVRPFSYFIEFPDLYRLKFSQNKKFTNAQLDLNLQRKYYLGFKLTARERTIRVTSTPGYIAHAFIFLIVSNNPFFTNPYIIYLENVFVSYSHGVFDIKIFDSAKRLYLQNSKEDNFLSRKNIIALEKAHRKILNAYKNKELIGFTADEVLELNNAEANYEIHAICKFNKLTYKIKN